MLIPSNVIFAGNMELSIHHTFCSLILASLSTQFRESLLIIVSTPLYAVLIISEILLSYFHHKSYYTLYDTLTNIYLSALNFLLDIALRGVCLLVLNYFFQFHFISFQHPWVYWTLLLIFQDFAYYLLHYVDHHSRFFWAVHVTHHSSDKFNLTVGFRSSVFQPLYRFFYFIPLSLLGFKGVDIMFMYAATQIYGILVHTRFVGKLGWLEYIFCTPSNHRVHHASNIPYLDKNMGMVLIIWDRLFGTYKAEEKDIAMEFGLTKKLAKHDPVNIVMHEWLTLKHDVLKKNISWKDKLRYIFAPPGWSHDGHSKTSKQLRKEYYEQLSQKRKL